MAVSYGFYNSQSHDRRYNAEQFSRMFNMLINDGVFASYGGRFMVNALNPVKLKVAVRSGFAWFYSTWTLNDEDLVLDIDPPNSVYNRIDTVVLEVNTSNSYRRNEVKIVKGQPTSSPQAPTLTNTLYIRQYPLANVTVPRGTTGITQSNITNRIGTTSTPWVTGILQTVDLTSMYAKWEEDFTKWLNGTKSEWSTLRETINSDIRDFIENGQVEIDDVIAAANQSIRNYEAEFQTFLATSGGTFDTQMDAWDAAFQEWFKNVQTSLEGDIGATLTLKVADLERRMTEAEGKITTQQTEVSGLKTNIQLLQSNLTSGLAGKLDKSAIATKTQAETGTLNSGYMTPLRTKEAIMVLSPPQDVSKVGDIRFSKFPDEVKTWSGEWIPMMGQYVASPSYSNPGGSYVVSSICDKLKNVSYFEPTAPLNASSTAIRVSALTDYIGPYSESNWKNGLFGCISDYTLRVNYDEPPILLMTINSRSSIVFLRPPQTISDGYQIDPASKNLGTGGIILGQILLQNKPIIFYMDKSVSATTLKIYATYYGGDAGIKTNSFTYTNTIGAFTAYNSNCVIATAYPSNGLMAYQEDGTCTTVVFILAGQPYRMCLGFSDSSQTVLNIHNPSPGPTPLPNGQSFPSNYPQACGLKGYMIYTHRTQSNSLNYLDVRTWAMVDNPFNHEVFAERTEAIQRGSWSTITTNKNSAFVSKNPNATSDSDQIYFYSADTKSATIRCMATAPFGIYGMNKCLFPLNSKAFTVAAGLYIPKNGNGTKMDSATYWAAETAPVRYALKNKGTVQFYRLSPFTEGFGAAGAGLARFRVFGGHYYQTYREDTTNEVLVGGIDSTSTGGDTAITPTHLYVHRTAGPGLVLWRVPVVNDGYLKIND